MKYKIIIYYTKTAKRKSGGERVSSLEFKNISKIFPGVKALDNISFKANGGEIIAMLGENGAGKSTLLKILNGDYQADGGQYLLNGEEKHFKSPLEAIEAGISIIYQERQYIPYLSVAENVFMEQIPVGKFKMINFKELNAKTQEIIDEFQLPFKATDRMNELSVAHQQMVEVMKAYRRKPKVIAFDEPTASLSDAEIDTLFEIIKKLKEQGIIILYVSHRMKEIFRITDQVVVIKDGKFVAQMRTKDTTEQELVKLMVGRDLGNIFDNLSRNTQIGDVVMEVKHLKNPWVHDVSFQLHRGEILGFAGLVGAGRTETMRAIFGVDDWSEGEIILDGRSVHFRHPKQAIRAGIDMAMEDRKDEGIFAIRSIMDNINVSSMEKVSRGQWLQPDKERKAAKRGIEEFEIKTPDEDKKIGELSGGNQQKVILARCLAAEPKVLILDEPTKGIDVGAKAEIYQMACDLAKKQIGVIVISSELPEILGLSDRILVMHNGKITGELKPKETTEAEILHYAMKETREER